MATAATRRKARNWFKGEGAGSSNVPAQRNTANMPGAYLNPLSHFFMDMDRMFGSFGFPSLGISGIVGMPTMFRPNVDIASNDNSYVITVEVPGMDEQDIRLNVSEDGMLTITGEKRLDNIEDRKDVVATECSYGVFQRTLSLPEDVDSKNIEAQFRNGVLTITCPRKPEQQKLQKREIPIGGRRGQGGGGREAHERMQSANERGGRERGSKRAA